MRVLSLIPNSPVTEPATVEVQDAKASDFPLEVDG
jgi:hypothetical protein